MKGLPIFWTSMAVELIPMSLYTHTLRVLPIHFGRETVPSGKKHGTNDHIFILKTLITKYVKRLKLNLYCCFIDFRKAFDSVWWNGLLLKMRYLGIGGKL